MISNVSPNRDSSSSCHWSSIEGGQETTIFALTVVLQRVKRAYFQRLATVDWQTSLEVDNAGFNVLRRARGGPWSVANGYMRV